eukprot:SAG22_NODE_277_length_13166_cov_134.125277_3_plen_252_part_00
MSAACRVAALQHNNRMASAFARWAGLARAARLQQLVDTMAAQLAAGEYRSSDELGRLDAERAALRAQLERQRAQHAAAMADVNEVLGAVGDEMNTVLRGVDSSIAATLASIDANRQRLDRLRQTTLRGLGHADEYLEAKVQELAAQHALELAAAQAAPPPHARQTGSARTSSDGGGGGGAGPGRQRALRLEPLSELQERHEAELAALHAAHDALAAAGAAATGAAAHGSSSNGNPAPPVMPLATTVAAQLE